MKLDFSQFHPLDHWPGTKRCRSFYGGTRKHLSMTWEYRRRDQVLHPLYSVLLCPLGIHAEQVWYLHEHGVVRIKPTCKHCDWTRLPSEKDIDRKVPPFA